MKIKLNKLTTNSASYGNKLQNPQMREPEIKRGQVSKTSSRSSNNVIAAIRGNHNSDIVNIGIIALLPAMILAFIIVNFEMHSTWHRVNQPLLSGNLSSLEKLYAGPHRLVIDCNNGMTKPYYGAEDWQGTCPENAQLRLLVSQNTDVITTGLTGIQEGLSLCELPTSLPQKISECLNMGNKLLRGEAAAYGVNDLGLPMLTKIVDNKGDVLSNKVDSITEFYKKTEIHAFGNKLESTLMRMTISVALIFVTVNAIRTLRAWNRLKGPRENSNTKKSMGNKQNAEKRNADAAEFLRSRIPNYKTNKLGIPTPTRDVLLEPEESLEDLAKRLSRLP